MKRSCILFLIFNMFVANSFSQKTDDVQRILDQLSAKVKSAKTLNSSFVLTQYDKSNHILASSKGLVKIKGDKYYFKEDKTEVFSDGMQTWNFDGNNEVIVSKSDNADIDDLSPRQILSGFSKNDFTYKLLSSTVTDYEVLLIPNDKRKNFKQVIIFVNKSASLVSKAKITDKTGNILQMNFSATSLNTNIPDSQFGFDVSKHPGVEIINQ